MKYQIVLSVGCLFALLACSNPFEPEYQLYGRVFDSKTNKPIEGASVYAKEVETGILHHKETDSLGNYSIENLALDSLTIEVNKTGYQSFSDKIHFVRNMEFNIGL